MESQLPLPAVSATGEAGTDAGWPAASENHRHREQPSSAVSSLRLYEHGGGCGVHSLRPGREGSERADAVYQVAECTSRPQASLFLDRVQERQIQRAQAFVCHCFGGKERVPLVSPMGAWAAASGRLTAESAVVPFGLVVSHQRVLGSGYPPIAGECQVAAADISETDVLPLLDLADMLIQPLPEGPATLGRRGGRFAYVHQPAVEVERIDAAFCGRDSACGLEQWAGFQLLDNLYSDPSIEIKLEPVRIA